MRRNCRSHLASVSLHQVQVVCQESVLSLNTVVFPRQIGALLPAYVAFSRGLLDMIAVVWQPVLVSRAGGWKQSP